MCFTTLGGKVFGGQCIGILALAICQKWHVSSEIGYFTCPSFLDNDKWSFKIYIISNLFSIG
jgi:hypothetical protein